MSSHSKIESIWYSRSRLLRIVLWPFSLLFLILVQLKRLLYRYQIISSYRFEKPVIVVGNITIGGTGKTPFINHLVRLLRKNEIKVGIVSRGYQSKIKTFPHQVLAENSATEVGDEAFMQFDDLNRGASLEVPMVIDPNRSQAVTYLLKNNDVDVVISDDGMQHYKMTRDVEVLLYDGERQFGNHLILPFGPLREPLGRLKSVDFVIQNGQKNSPFSEYSVKLNARKLIHLKTGKEISLEDFSGRKVIAVAGIGNPERFFKSLGAICIIENSEAFVDHYDFSVEDFSLYQGRTVVMTEKDASKCYEFAEDNWYYLKVEMIFEKILSEKMLSTIKDKIAQKY